MLPALDHVRVTRPGSRGRWGRLALLAALTCALGADAEAQYFGRNKVRYETYDFQVLRTEHFDIHYYSKEREAAELAGRMAERWYARFARLLNHQFADRQPVVLYASHPDFEQTNALEGEIGEGTGGATEMLKRRIVLPMAGALAETDHVLGHEIVHAFQFDITSAGGAASGGVPGALRMPLWFIEGMAEYLTLGPVDAHTAMWMRDAVQRNRVPDVKKLGDPRYFPYRYGQAFWAYVGGRWGDEMIGRMLKASARAQDPERILQELLGLDEKTLSKDWHDSLRKAYGLAIETKKQPPAYGPAIVTDRNGGDLNVGPALSPDGKQLLFLSEKGLFAIELYLADARTGEIKKKIVKTAVDPHFESLQFINSSGAWDAAGRRFAFAAVTKGKPVVTVLDLAGGGTKEYDFPDLDEIYDPTFSPDGRQVAFTANVGGLLDLYAYDLGTRQLRRLTQDAYAELQPAWSPDGTRIVFVTDRFGAQLGELAMGSYRLALIDAQTGEVSGPLAGFDGAKAIDPQWSADGRSVYFLSDRTGATNIYRLEVGSGQLLQVTDLLTGVSGITALSPALAVSAGRIAYSVYQDDKYSIWSIEDPAIMAGAPALPEGRQLAALPPLERRHDEVVALNENATLGLPGQRTFATKPYSSKLSLVQIGQVGVGVGTSPLGTYVGGGVSLLFSDMLGDQMVGATIQANGSVKDIGGYVGYENRKHRWTWGGAIQSVPLLSAAFASGPDTINGQRVFVEQTEIFRETHRAAQGYVAYPFSRAKRFEVSAGVRNISFDRELQTDIFNINSGELIADDKQDLEAPSGLTLGEASAALVHDSSLFGVASPILGQRYRFEVAPTVGSLSFTGVLADYRRYFMPVRPYTLAVRLLHYGRYGSGGEDPRIQPLFLGYPTLVRGYDFDSFSASECGTNDGSCPVYDQLLGSRMAVVNAELRFPPFSAFGGRRFYGPLPLELLVFADAGVAWTAGDKAEFLGGQRKPVRSWGAGARVNLFGFAVIEIDYVRPLDRPLKKSLWQFSFVGGY
jgi:surface antigen Omp85-like protein/WD40 repeat protein